MNPGSRYVKLLNGRQPNLNNGTVAGGLAHALTQGMRGYAARKAEDAEQQKVEQRQQAITEVLEGMNRQKLTSDGPTQPSAGAPFENPGRMAQLLGDPATAPFVMRMVDDAMKPPAERKSETDVNGVRRWLDNGQQVFEGVQPRRDPIKVGNVLVDPTTYQPVYQGPEDNKRYLSIPGIGVMDLTTNQLVTPGTPAPDTSGALNLPTVPPAGANLPPKSAEKVLTADAQAAYQEVGKMREQITPLVEMADMATRFGQLLEKQDTGGLLRRIPGAGTLEGAFDPEIQEMQSLTDKITPLMRQGMPGAASDTDVRMFRGATFGPDKSPEVNSNIIIGMQTAAQNAQERLAFMEAYVGQQNTLRGANEAWQKYLNANPIFDPNGNPATPTINTGRQSWREYFTEGPKQSGLSADERAELEQLRKEFRQ